MYAAHTSPSSGLTAGPKDPPASRLVSAWARRRRQITPWAYPRLRALAILRLVIGIFLTGLGAVIVTRSSAPWSGVIPLVFAAVHFSIAALDGAAARSAPRPS